MHDAVSQVNTAHFAVEVEQNMTREEEVRKLYNGKQFK